MFRYALGDGELKSDIVRFELEFCFRSLIIFILKKYICIDIFSRISVH